MDPTASERLIQTLDMYEFGVEMMAARLRRAHPQDTPEQIEQRLADWLAQRPGAEEGDGPGVPVAPARFR